MTAERTPRRDGGRRSATLVIQTAFLGDVVLTTPLLSALAARYGPVDVVTTPAAAALLETHPAVREVIRYDKRGADAGLAGFWRIASRLRAAVVRSGRAAAPVVALGGARAGSQCAGADGLRRRPARDYLYHADSARPVGARGGPPAGAGRHRRRGSAFGLPGAGRAGLLRGGRVAGDGGLAAGFVALAPGSIWGTKRWPYYPELAAALNGPIVVIGGPEDGEIAATIVERAPTRVHSAAGALTLRQSAALIARARILVTNDSAPLHLGTAVGTPIVALFGPTAPAQGFGPRGAGDVALGHAALACRPCSAHGPHVCPLLHHRCMRELSVETVVAAVPATRRGGSGCDSSWALTSAAPTSSSGASPRTAPCCTPEEASRPTPRRARATWWTGWSPWPSGRSPRPGRRCRARRSSVWVSARRDRSTPRAGSCC